MKNKYAAIILVVSLLCVGAIFGPMTTQYTRGLLLKNSASAARTYLDIAGSYATLGANTFTRLQTITQGTANEGLLASTGYSLTGSGANGLVDLAGTWNTSGNPVALKIAIVNTSSGSSSKAIQYLAGVGGATEKFAVDKSGNVTSAGNITASVTSGILQGNLLNTQSSASPVAVSATGWTNSFGGNATIFLEGTGMTFVVYNGGPTACYTNSSTQTFATIPIQGNGKIIITAGTGVTGIAVPW